MNYDGSITRLLQLHIVVWMLFSFVSAAGGSFIDLVAQESPVRTSQTILVTGGAGFVGSHVADVLLERGDKVVIIDEMNDYYNVSMKEQNLRLLQEKYPNHPLHIYHGDICNTTLLTEIFQQHPEITMICHMAARAGVRPSIQDPFIYIHSNILGTVTLLFYAAQYKITNFVFASSSSVYGGSKSTFFSEDEPVDHPISPYAATKKACELFAYVYAQTYALPVTALRFFTVYGPRGRPDMAPYKFIDRIRRGQTIQQFGDGSSSRDYTYISDIVQGIVHSLDRPTEYAIYNLGKGSGTVLKDFVALVEQYVGRKANIEYLPDQPGDVPYTCANISYAQQFIDYVPNVPFAEGIQKTVQWFQEIEGSLDVNESQHVRHRRLMDRPSFLDFDNEMVQVIPETIRTWTRRRLSETALDRSSPVPRHAGYKKVWVSGAGTFVGSYLVEALLARGDDVVVLDFSADMAMSSETQGSNGRGKLLVADLSHWESVMKQERPEWIVHLGMEPESTEAGEFTAAEHYIQNNIDWMARLLEYTSQERHVQNFLVASSYAVYGAAVPTAGDRMVRREDERVDYPKSAYGASMKAAELLAYTYHHLYRIPISILRLFPVYGPQYSSGSAAFRLVDTLVSPSRRPHPLRDTDDSLWIASIDWTHVDDIVQGLLSALDRPQRGYEIFNLGSGYCDWDHFSTFLRHAVQMSSKHHSLSPKNDLDRIVAELETTWLSNVDGISCADIQKAEELLEYHPRYQEPSVWESSIYETIKYHLQTFYPPVGSDDHDRSRPVQLPELKGYETLSALKKKEEKGTLALNISSDNVHALCGVDMLAPGNGIFSTWLRRFAFVQWLLVLIIVTLRLYYKTPFGCTGGGRFQNNRTDHSSSSSLTPKDSNGRGK